MKKIFVFVLALALIAGVYDLAFAGGPTGPNYPGDIMGMTTGRYASDPHRSFRLVRQNGPVGSITITAGSVVIWDTTAFPTCADGVSVTTTATSGDARVAGIMATTIYTRDSGPLGTVNLTASGSTNHSASEDVGLKNWGWLQVYGLSVTHVTSDCAIAAVGTPVCAGSATGSISKIINEGSATSAVPIPFGFAETDCAANNVTPDVFIRGM